LLEVEGSQTLREGLGLEVSLLVVPQDVLGLEPDCIFRLVGLVLGVETAESVADPEYCLHDESINIGHDKYQQQSSFFSFSVVFLSSFDPV
jgi:hypothetical protein